MLGTLTYLINAQPHPPPPLLNGIKKSVLYYKRNNTPFQIIVIPNNSPLQALTYRKGKKLAAKGSRICKYLYRRNGKEMFTLIQKEIIMHLFMTSQTIFPSDMTSRVRQDISHNCILCMCNNSQINKSHFSSNNIFTHGIKPRIKVMFYEGPMLVWPQWWSFADESQQGQ